MDNKKYILVLDQGTTSSRCIIFDNEMNVVAKGQKEFEQVYPKPGWVEHVPEEILYSELSASSEAIREAGISPDEIAGIGITNQRETTIVWDRETGKPVYNAIVWQCTRSESYIEKIKKDGLSDKIREKTGLKPDAYFSASKIAWILDNVKGVRERAEAGELAFGTVDTWLIWNLTDGKAHVTDYTNASRTMLFNINTLEWDKELVDYFNIPMSMLPEVKPSMSNFATTDKTVFGEEIMICGVAGDQQAALFGQCCFEKGDAKNTYGTGCFLLMNTGEDRIASKNGLLTTLAAGSTENSPRYALEGSVFIAGAVVKWLRDEMFLISTPEETYDLAMSIKDNDGVYIVPAFVGLGAPYWDRKATGAIGGLTRGSGRAHIVRAALESIAYQTYDVIKAMESDADTVLTSLKIDGGACTNDFLAQFQSDILRKNVIRPINVESTAIGAAFLAGLGAGLWKSKDELKELVKVGQVFTPNSSENKAKKNLDGWHRAVETTIGRKIN